MKDISRTLIIGLGGTGQKVIRDIKKRLFQRYGEIPSLVKFLCFDSDIDDYQDTPFKYYYNGENRETKKYNLQRDEFRRLGRPGIEVLQKDPICRNLDFCELSKMYGLTNGIGANGFRSLGRALFLYNSGDIIAMLNKAVNDLRNANMLETERTVKGYNIAGNNITVYVIASLAGGTGSSAIMDISRMLQIAGINVQYNANPNVDKIFGMFFLPKFFEDKPNTSNIRINAFTALSELDYTIGLADERKYPTGSIELENDQQDYHGYINDGKRVIYDGVYLIDSITEHGHFYSHISEAAIFVASFIASSIAVDAGTLTTSFANSQHKMHAVDGKCQNYSGLGYCEIHFVRREFVRYLLNKKLISVLEQFKSGDNGVGVNQIAQSFIEDNRLNEGVMQNSEGEDTRSQLNELTDAIINMSNRLFSGIPMRNVNTGRDAADEIEVSKTKYLHDIDTAAQQAVQAFKQRKQELLKSLKAFLDERMTGKGFGRFPDLVKCLKTMLAEMKSGLEDELNQNDALFDRIDRDELRWLKNVIAEYSSRGFMGIGNKHPQQKEAIRSYCNQVHFDVSNQTIPTLAWLVVDTARKKEAVAVYEEMIEIIDSYYKEETVETLNGIRMVITGSFLNIDALYQGLLDQLLCENNCYKPSKAAKNEIVFADAYFKEYFEQNGADVINLPDQEEFAFEKYIGQLFAGQPIVNEEKLVEMRKKLLDLLPSNGIIREIQEVRLSIDDLFIRCFGSYHDIVDCDDMKANPQLPLLVQVNYLFETLWKYVDFRGQGLEPSKNVVVGVYDTQNCIFNPQNGYQAVIDGSDIHYSYINLGDPDKIVFMLTETGIPAHKLVGVEDWAKEFIQRNGDVYTFSDKRLEDIEMITSGMYEEAEIAWAYGWLFGLITNPINKKGLRVKPSYGLAIKNAWIIEANGDYKYFTNAHPSDIYDCHQKFIKGDIELSKDIYEQAMTQLVRDPIGNAEKIKEWVNEGKMWSPEVRGKQRASMTPKELRVIQDEVKYLAMRFDKLGLSLNECGMAI